MLFFTESDVRQLLPMATCIDLMHSAFQELAAGRAQNQPRRRLVLPTGSTLHQMAGSYGNYFGAKIYSTHPRHGAHFLFALYRAADAELLALFEANYLGQIRTGAASGLATRLLARQDAHRLAILGSGFQARSQLEAMRCVRPIREVKVWSRSPDKRNAFAGECSVTAAASAEEAVRDADIVVTATNSKDPVVEAAWISPGAHINAMGSNHARRRELPAGVIHRAGLIVVDSIEQARLEAGDLLLALDEKAWGDLAELKDIVARRPSLAPGAITIFKSLGLGVEDCAAAAHVYERKVELQLQTG